MTVRGNYTMNELEIALSALRAADEIFKGRRADFDEVAAQVRRAIETIEAKETDHEKQ